MSSGMNPTPSSRLSPRQKSAMARLCARVPPYSTSGVERTWSNSPQKCVIAKVVKTNCELKPSRSSARRRSSGSKAPSASHPLRSIRFCSASATAAGFLCRSSACAMALSTSLPPDPIASGCSLGRMSGSAWEISQSRVSMTWLSASLKIRPSAYGIAITSALAEFARHMPARFGLQDNAGKGAPYRGKKLAKRMRSHKSNLSLARRSDNSMSMRSRHPAALALLSLLGAFCVVACATPLWAQSQTEPLKTFTDPDDAFSFRYSNNLIHCEQKKQGNSEQLYWDPGESCSAYHPVCDELLAGERHTSIVCFGYPRNKFTDTRAFEAATFSVEVVDDSTTEKSCLAGLTDADADKKGITKINGVSFSVFGLGSLGSNQSVNVDLYRTFYRGKCYQLGIDVATAAAAVFDPHARDLTDADWNEVNGTLEQARKSFRFLNTTAIAHSWFLMITPIGKDG